MKTALGKGLDALIPRDGSREVIEVDLERIVAAEEQPRKVFRDGTLKELASSIKEKGVLQPVLLRRSRDGYFTLIAGERRYRAARMAGLKKIPALVKDSTPEDSLEIALIENIQREDLGPLETAQAFQRLIKQFGLTQEKLSEKVSKDRATVANYLRILSLPEEVKKLINEGALSMGHAKALLSLTDRQKMLALAGKVVKQGLSVREAEKLSREGTKAAKQKPPRPPEVAALEDRLIKSLGTRVKVKDRGKRGSIEIEYYSLEELDRLLDLLLG
jgi:ParB family chromosome partitioning protein